jgi:hydrogenase maturation factor HypF (carbamoyltransferase family)
MERDDDHIARRIEINGVVQGVGFRPFIFGVAEQISA